MGRLRKDYSDKLVHLIRGTSDEECFDTLLAIINCGYIEARNGGIKGGHNCVCLSESPTQALRENVLFEIERYRPWGFIFNKQDIFSMGGRPVIYQPDSEYDLLPNTHQWRHVRFDPPDVNWTWEREWRINRNLPVKKESGVSIILKNREWLNRFQEHKIQYFTLQYSQIMDELEAQQLAELEASQWPIVVFDEN